jgi:enolase
LKAKELSKLAPPEILKIEGRQIIDSRGNPTVEAGESFNHLVI